MLILISAQLRYKAVLNKVNMITYKWAFHELRKQLDVWGMLNYSICCVLHIHKVRRAFLLTVSAKFIKLLKLVFI